ncbi:MAG: protein kinase [Planctomycetes bacterium]|nr:protein kinase [Planctomycetota bacterium]
MPGDRERPESDPLPPGDPARAVPRGSAAPAPVPAPAAPASARGAADPREGSVLAGEFRLLRALGSGGMGTVYLAEQLSLRRQVAVKLPNSPRPNDEEKLLRFRREAELSGRLNHPNIVQVFMLGREGNEHFLAMEYVDGESLRARVQREEKLAPLEALRVGVSLLRALAAAHERKIIHRDVKPENVFLTRKGELKLGDFGIARSQGGDEEITGSGYAIGTPAYMAPEQWVGGPVDERADLYAAGGTIFYALTGRPPYSGSKEEMMLKCHQAPIPSARGAVPEVPPEAEALLRRLLAKSPAERPSSAEEAATALEAIRAALLAGVDRAAPPWPGVSARAVPPAPAASPRKPPAAPPPTTSIPELRNLRFDRPVARDAGTPPPLPLRRLGPCRMLSVLGTAAWGSVFLAHHELLGTQVTLKLLPADIEQDAEKIARFEAEAQLSLGLRHTHIRRTLEAGWAEGHCYMVMEYVDGLGLDALVELNGPLSAGVAAAATRRIALGLAYAQGCGVLHRGVSPHNVLVSRQGEVLITDFGLPRLRLAIADEDSTPDAHGALFYNPEQFNGGPQDRRSDIYSLGCTLFFMVTGRPPFEGRSLPDLLRLHTEAPPPSPLRYRRSLPQAFCSVLSRMLEKDPARRFQDYAALIRALDEAEQDRPASLVVFRGTDTPAPGTTLDEEAASHPKEEAAPTDERVRRCSEIQELFVRERMIPPPLRQLMLGLGFAREETEWDRGQPLPDVALRCRHCSTEVALGGAGAPLGITCPRCEKSSLEHPWFSISSFMCYVRIVVSPAAFESADGPWSVVNAAARIGFSGKRNVVLDCSSAPRLSDGLVEAILELREHATIEQIAPTLVLAPEAAKAAKLKGLDQVVLIQPSDRDAFAEVASGRLCPHLRSWLVASRGQINLPANEATAQVETSLAPCVEPAPFRRFYDSALTQLQETNAPALLSAGDQLVRAFPPQRESCLAPVAAWVADLAREALRAKMEREALFHLDREEVLPARRLAEKLRRHFPDAEAAFDILGQIAMREGKFPEAAISFAMAACRSNAPETHILNRAAAQRRAGTLEQAAATLDDLLRRSPRNDRALLLLGVIHYERGEYPAALGCFDLAHRRVAGDPRLLAWRAQTNRKLGRLEASLSDYASALALEPNDAHALGNCGALCLKLGRAGEALAYLDRATALNPVARVPHFNRACAQATLGDLQAALGSLEAAGNLGWEKASLLRAEPALQPLRDDPRFAGRLQELLGQALTRRKASARRRAHLEGS